MNKIETKLRWFQGNPYIMEWRSRDENNYNGTWESLNKKWNANISYDRVANTLDEYLSVLMEYVKYTMRSEARSDLVRGGIYFKERFSLNETETTYVKNNFYCV